MDAIDTPLPSGEAVRTVAFWDTALCSTIGSIFLVSADLVYNGTRAVTLKLAAGAEMIFPHWADTVAFESIAFIVMLMMGLGLCYVYRPRTRLGAFARGSSVISVLVGMNIAATAAVAEAKAIELDARTPVSTCEPRSYGPFGLGTLINKDSKGCWTTGVVDRRIDTRCLERSAVGKQTFCRISLGGRDYWVQTGR